MPVKRYNGTSWETVAGDGAPGADGTAPLTTKGDLLSFGTTPSRLAVGSKDQILIADSSQTLGIKWADLDAKPDIFMLMGA